LFAQVVLKPVHHTDDDDERAHGHGDAENRDHADQGEQFRSAAAPQIPPGDGQLESSHSGRSVGNRITSRMFAVFVRYMNSRSMPIPTPPMGGMPYSIARK